MLIDFTVQNYRSIKDEQTLTLSVGRGRHDDKTMEFSTGTPNTPDLLRSAVIFGPNASGKSSFLQAINTMMTLVIHGVKKGEKLPADPFLYDPNSRDEPSEFECHFVKSEIRYRYGFAFNEDKIFDEWLYCYPKGQKVILFERFSQENQDDYEWKFGASLRGEKISWRDQTRDNALFLSVAVDLNSDQLSPVYEWFDETLRTISIDGLSDRFTASLAKDAEKKAKILSFLQAADLHIDDIRVTTKKFEDMIPDVIPESMRSEMISRIGEMEVFDVEAIHKTHDGESVLFDLEDESDGTQRIFQLAGPWIDSLENGYVVIVDELDGHLHPLLMKFLLNLFQNPETNPKNAQLVFTTHDVTILDQKIMRRDQVWFVDKNKQNETELFSLVDFMPKKGIENIMLGYMTGRYEALPKIKNSFFRAYM